MNRDAEKKRNAAGSVAVVIPVRNPGPGLLDTLRAVAAVTGGDAVAEILVVDDASFSGSEWFAQAAAEPRVRVLKLTTWSGCGGARDAGARAATADLVWFLDADCIPHADALTLHLSKLGAGADISLGLVASPGEGFWGRYEAAVLARRARAAATGQSMANSVLRRDVYLSLGGFDTNFRRYGFEDRDFILRALGADSRMQTTPDSLAVHRGNVSLQSVCRKLNEAARLSAPHFRQLHPDEYRRSLFGWLDVRGHGAVLAGCGRALSALQAPLQRLADASLDKKPVPYGLKLVLVKGAIALAYLRGSCGLTLAGDRG